MKLPAWLTKILGPLQSAIVSKLLSFQDILVFAVANDFSEGKIHNFHTLFGDVFGASFWFGITISLFFGIGPYYRVAQKVESDKVGVCAACGAKGGLALAGQG